MTTVHRPPSQTLAQPPKPAPTDQSDASFPFANPASYSVAHTRFWPPIPSPPLLLPFFPLLLFLFLFYFCFYFIFIYFFPSFLLQPTHTSLLVGWRDLLNDDNRALEPMMRNNHSPPEHRIPYPFSLSCPLLLLLMATTTSKPARDAQTHFLNLFRSALLLRDYCCYSLSRLALLYYHRHHSLRTPSILFNNCFIYASSSSWSPFFCFSLSRRRMK